LQVVKDITFEVTMKCNLSCAMCSRQFLSDKTSELQFDMAREVIADLAANYRQPVNISIGGYGEPLLYSQLGQLLRLIKKGLPRSQVTLTSNAHLLSPERGRMLLESGLDYLRLSLNATTAAEYARLMRSSKFAEVEENIAAFLRQKNQNGNHMKVGLQILDTKENKERFPQYKKKWEGLLKGEDFIAYRLLENRGGVIDSAELSQGSSPGQMSSRYPCYALWRYIALDTKGRVYACCEAYTFREKPTLLCLGSLDEKSITDIIEGEQLKMVQDLHLKNQYRRLPECWRCSKPINYPNYWVLSNGQWVEKS
jgi:MoaA/NifB/PqqE/SkfB family radical SAM enzyme